MNTYYLRCIAADFNQLKALGEMLGAITVIPAHTEETTIEVSEGVFETSTISVPEAVVATQQGYWDFIGPIYQPTGATIEVEGFGPQPVMAALTDAEGNEYVHVNLITPINLKEAATLLAVAYPEIAAGLANLGKYFLVDANGDAKPPAVPHRVFAT